MIKDFFPPETWRRLQDAAKAMAEQYVAQAFTEMHGNAIRGSRHMSFTPGRPPAIRRLSTYAPEPTRRTMTCGSCSESYAVFGIALYCVKCGALPPAERFTEVLQVQRRLLSHFDDLPAELRVQMEADGAFTRIYEDTVKDTFGALESFLDGVFRSRVAGAACLLKKQGNVFQRLAQASVLYEAHLQVPLDVLDVPAWATLLDGTALRHVLTHSNGVVDAKYLLAVPTSPYQVGQRVHVSRADAVATLDAATVLGQALLAALTCCP